jgi:hypothetical protein
MRIGYRGRIDINDDNADVEGEWIRKDIRDSQEGVPLYFEFQVIDTNTCEPVSGAYFDMWHGNGFSFEYLPFVNRHSKRNRRVLWHRGGW